MGQDTVLKTIRQFKKALETINIRVDQLILYGSHAVDTAREDSDIDVVVISPSFSIPCAGQIAYVLHSGKSSNLTRAWYNKSYWERIDILTDAIYHVCAPIEASAFTPEEWKTEKSLIVDYAKNGILVK